MQDEIKASLVSELQRLTRFVLRVLGKVGWERTRKGLPGVLGD